PLTGIIDGRIEFSGPLDDPSAHLSLALQDSTFGAYAIGSGVADLTMTHQTIDIDRFEIHPAQGQVAAKGRVDLRGSSQVEVSAQDLNPDFLRPFFQIDRPLQGKLNFTVQLSGETRNPTAGLSLEATDAGIAGALADRIAGLAYYQAGTLHIEQAVISKGPHKVVAVGTLPVDQKTFAFDPNAPMQLQLRLQDADLSFLTLLTPQVTDAAGTVAGEVDVAGTVGRPEMSGFLHSTGGKLTYAGLRKPIDKMNVDLVFSQNEILVRDLSAALGQGQVAIGGTVGVTNFRLGDIGLALKATHADIDAPGLYTGLLDADLRLSGPALEPVLSGSATLSEGVLSPAGTGGGPGGGGPRLGLDVTLAVGHNVVFSLGPIRAEVAGSVHAAGTLAHPLLSGLVTSPQGEVAFLGSTFRLTGGQAVFSEALGVEPQISARAQQVYGDTIVFLDVRGLASHPDLTVTSDPPLTQADILNLVARNAGIFGDPGSILGQGLGRYLLGSLREALDLNEFTLTYNRESPVTLRIGKFLLQNIYVTVSEVFAGPQVATIPFPGTFTRPVPPDVSYTVAGLEYFLSPNVLATLNVDTLGGMGVFLLTRFPF
ncbi:MAG TPA: translocation/assembly module TamB domain-containing protein, partial [bacterium]|nr:translocation/assembly module TamB domain-containing protein [bacterium]